MVLDRLFKEVRTEVYIPNAKRPLIYSRDEGDIKAWNSGGRGLIFTENGITYRVKGVDPKAYLTEKVVSSGKNLISDVNAAVTNYRDLGAFMKMHGLEPFGVLLEKKAENEKFAVDRINELYRKLGVEPSLEFDEIVSTNDGYVQNWFRLKKTSDDLRLEELDQYLVQKFSKMPRGRIENYLNAVMKLYGRFNIWNGRNMRLMVDAKLKPTPTSFLPQNFTISSVDDGYGLFRVDHTSTEYLPEKSEGEIFDSLQKNVDGFLEGTLLRLPTAMIIAAEPQSVNPDFWKTTKKQKVPFFKAAYNYQGEVKSARYKYFHDVLIAGFLGGFNATGFEPIDESFFKKVLE